ncbi:hypothetical protein [Pseudonocardia adelaidensis]|uniref:DUF1616 domain-containing protein n=1 Tax=Pseudonocardia adelaidensis TaxID=648754 RepID=A0ABP9N8T1_9PSEU
MNTEPGRMSPQRGRLLLNAVWSPLRRAPRWRWALAISGWTTLLAVLLAPSASPPRVVLVFGFVLVCPGLAVCLLLPMREAVERWVYGVALSIALAILLNTALTLLANGSVALRLVVLATITTVAVLIATVRDGGERQRLTLARAQEVEAR